MIEFMAVHAAHGLAVTVKISMVGKENLANPIHDGTIISPSSAPQIFYPDNTLR